MFIGKEFRMYALVPALKEFLLPRLKKTSTKGTFLLLNLLIQLPPAARSGKTLSPKNCFHFSWEEDDFEGGRET